MSMTHAQKAILQAAQKKQNCNLVQERKYDDYGDYGDVHGDYYDCVYEPVEMVVEKPDILQGIKNILFQNTK